MSTAEQLAEQITPVAVLTALPLPTDHWRPATRGECPTERPCPYVGCRHHLYLEVGSTGEVRLNWPDRDPDELAESCARDVAERGGASLDEVGRCFGLTRERIRQIEAKALAKAKIALRRLGLRAEQIIPEVEQWRDEDEERPLRRAHLVAAEPAPRLSSDEQVWWFGEPPESQEEQVAAARALAEMRQRRLADAAGEVEEVTTMEATAKTTSEHEQPTPTLCPCGCGREVRPGRMFASKGCSGRMRFRGIDNPRLKETAAVPEPETSAADALAEELRDARRAVAEEHERYEKQLRHSASLDETIRRRNERVAELEQQLATVREETARRYEQEAAALTARLEAAEAENARLLSSLHEERRQREEIVEALDLSPGAPLDAILRRIESLTEAEQGEQEAEPLDLACLPRPADLPCGYAFQVAEYVSDLADRLMGGAAAPKE